MPYEKTIWINDKTKLNADNLNKIENGIKDNDVRIIEIENAYLKYVEFNHDTKELKFVKEDNKEIVVNIPNKVIDLKYDSSTQNLVLTLEDNSQLTTSLKDLLFVGSDNLTTKVTIENNKIKVELKEGSVSENYLSTSFKEKVDNKAEQSDLTAQDNRIKLIENAYIKSVEYEPGTGIFRFTMQDGTIKTMDLAIEKVVTNFEYDLGENLAGLTASIPVNNLTCSSGYGLFSLNGSVNGSNLTNVEKNFGVGYRNISEKASNNIFYLANGTTHNIGKQYGSGKISLIVTGGIDAANQDLIQWLKDINATIEGLKPNPSLKLTLADGTVQSIPLSDFITDYEGVENDQIQVSVQSGNKIEAILKDNSVTLAKINDDVKEHFASKEDVVSQIGDINSILATLVDVGETKLITFIINLYDYTGTTILVTTEAKQGMTWREWAESEYNTYGAIIEQEAVIFPIGSTSLDYRAGICVGAGSINIDDPIDPDTTYVLD